MKLSQHLKSELGNQYNANLISELTNGALSKRTANNWFNGDKRPILDLVIDGLKYRNTQLEHNAK